MDDVICDFVQSYNESKKKNPNEKYPQSKEGFFLNLPPINKSIEVINRLRGVEIFDVYILTAPSVRNPLCYTEKRLWIEQKFDLDMARNLIISPNKGLNKGDYLIDDNINGKGQENFEGKVLHFGSPEFENWSLIWNYFKSEYDIKDE